MTVSRKNVIVVGASYVGLNTANELVKVLPAETHRVILIDKHSHFHHLFAFPRFAIASSYEHKAFIPIGLPEPHIYLPSTTVESISSSHVQLSRGVQLDGKATSELPYDALVIATGTTLSPPGSIPGEATKRQGIEYLRSVQNELRKADKIAILGGGAVGVQMATDLAVLYKGSKQITVVQSRTMMPRFHPALHDLVMKRFDELGVKTVLGSRAVVPEDGFEGASEVRTQDGRIVKADYVINATGQSPNSDLLKSFAPSAITSSGYIAVKPTLQIAPAGREANDSTERIFAVGDIADSGAPKAARPGMVQAGIVARNIASLLAPSSSLAPVVFDPPIEIMSTEPVRVQNSDDKPNGVRVLETYKPDPAGIHLTLGVIESVVFRNPPRDQETGEWKGEPHVWMRDDGREDMGIEGVWARRAGKVESEEDYWR